MRFDWQMGNSTGLWQAPAALGVGLILIGIILIIWPALLSIVLAIVFITIGISLLGTAWRLSRSPSTTYRRLDDEFPPDPRI